MRKNLIQLNKIILLIKNNKKLWYVIKKKVQRNKYDNNKE